MVYYDGSHSISFINQDWNEYSDFTHKFEEGIQNGIPKVKYLGHLRRDNRAHDDRNTWEDWGLVPTSPPIVAPPKQKRSSVEIPGTSGNVDLSYILAPWPTFQSTTGNWDFYITDRSIPLSALERKIGSFLHGRDVRVVLQDDPAYYYEGICEIGSINRANDGSYSTISINYDLQPYKKCIYNSIEEWEWNPFNFETDYISKSIFGDRDIKGGAKDSRYYLDINTSGKLKAYNADNGRQRDPYDPLPNDFKDVNIINLSDRDEYHSITGSMPVIPKFKIKFSGSINSSNFERNHDFGFVGILYRNYAINNSNYFTVTPKYSIEEIKNKIDNNEYFEFVDPEIVLYNTYKRRTYSLAFYSNIKSRIKCYVSVEFTKGEIL